MIGRHYLLQIVISLLLFIVCIHPSIAVQKRIALVIGNSSYKDSPLKNPINDAMGMTSKLTSFGFDVIKLINADKRSIDDAIRDFGKKLIQKDTVGLFYFAGHGLQVNNQNYLVPIGARIENESDVKYEAIDIGRVLGKMDYAQNGLNLVILDACRNNPYTRSFRSSSRGLTLTRPATGTLILYATEPGNVAADGSGKNGLFTEKLMTAMNTPGVKVQDVFQNTANAVNNASAGKQTPWSEGTIIGGNFYFSGKVTINQPQLQLTDAETISYKDRQENIFWNSIDKAPSVEGYRTYLQQYPKGHYVPVANYRIKQLSKQKTMPAKAKPAVTHAKLTIRSNVYGDTVTLNGDEKGSTKLDLQLKAGTYELEISKKGYRSWKRSLQIHAGNNQTIYAKLKKIPKQTKAVVKNDVKVVKKLIYKRDSLPISIRESITGMELIKIPSGCFQMGSNNGTANEKPKHRVCITDDYYLGKYEVTQDQWQKIMGKNPSIINKDHNYPVNQVSWNDVQIFIHKLNSRTGKNYRLPTEAEWEYACRSGGKEQRYCGGNSVDSVAWYRGSKSGNKTRVGQKQANGLGLYDMSGNVSEWVQDRYAKKYYQNSPIKNPAGPLSGLGRVIRGGNSLDNVSLVRAVDRIWNEQYFSLSNLGFRLAKTH
jgi:formylglycine-generating enzyme required for sulfatase activity